MPAAPPTPAGPPPGAWRRLAAPGSKGRAEDQETRVATFCAAVLQQPGAAAAALRDALAGTGGGSDGEPAGPEAGRAVPAEVLGAAWRACLNQLESRSDEAAGGGRPEGAPDADPAQPAAAPDRSPDLLGGDVGAGARTLDPAERAALALGAWPEVGPGDIAEVLGLADDAEADRAVGRARLALAAQLRGEDPPVLDDDPAECSRALGLMVRRRDVGLGRREDREWVDAHLAACPRCPERRRAMGEAALAWRAWTPPEPEPPELDDHAILETGAGVSPPRPLPGRPPRLTWELRREISRRAGAALVGATLIGVGAFVLAPGSGRPSRPPAPRPSPPAGARAPHHGRLGFTSAPVRLPPAQPQR